jgi:UDP-glucose-4-epimerase GalE
VPIREDAPQAPLSPYGRSKLMCERIIADCRAAYGIESVGLRYFNAAGADPEGELGEDHDPETHLIPLALLAAAGRSPPRTLFGDDYATPDGTCIRDYVHVSDIAEAHLLALDFCATQGSGWFNLGSEDGLSVREIIAAVEAVTGRAVPHQIGPRRPGDAPRLVADATAARAVLGWRPRYPEARIMIADAWSWLCKTL